MDDEERKFWARAALRSLRAHRAMLNQQNKKAGAPSSSGVAHMAAEDADALLAEFRRRFRKQGP